MMRTSCIFLILVLLLAAAGGTDPIPPPRPVPEKVLRARACADEHVKNWKAVDDLAARGELAEAIPRAEKLVATERELLGPDHPLTRESLLRLVAVCRSAGEYRKAQAATLEAAGVYARLHGPDDWRVRLAKLQADWDGRMAKLTPAQLDRLGPRLDRAINLFKQGNDREAIPEFKAYLASAAELIGPESYPVILWTPTLGECYSNLSEFRKAQETFDRALALTEKVLGKAHPQYATVLDKLGTMAMKAGDYDRAEKLFVQALGISIAAYGERHYACAVIRTNLGYLSIARGDYQRAEAEAAAAVEIFREQRGAKDVYYAGALYVLGTAYQEKGDFDRSERAMWEALDVARASGPHGDSMAAPALNGLARVYHSIGDYEQAARFYRQALAILHRMHGEEHDDYATVLVNLAGIYSLLGDLDRAITEYERALAIQKKLLGEEHPGYAYTLSFLGSAYRQTGNLDKAAPLLQRAAEVLKQRLGPQHPEYADSLLNLAHLARQRGDYALTERLVMDATKIQTNVYGPDYPGADQDLLTLADVHARTGRSQSAQALLSRALDSQESRIHRVLGFATETAMQRYVAEANEALEMLISFVKGRALTDAAARELVLTWVLRRKGAVLDAMCRYRELNRAMVTHPEVAEQAARVRWAFKAYMGRLAQPVGANEELFRAQIKELRREFERREADLHRLLDKVHPPSSRPAAVTIEAVRKQLPRGAALVEFLRFTPFNFAAKPGTPAWGPLRYAAFVFTHDPADPPAIIDLGEAKLIDSAIQEYCKDLNRTVGDLRFSDEKVLDTVFRENAAEVAAKVFTPLRAALGGAKTVFLAPDAALNLLPFDALAEKGKYLIESYRFRYLTSGRDLLRKKAPAAEGTVVFAAPDFDWQPKVVLAPAPRPGAGTTLTLRGIDVRQLRSSRWQPLKAVGAEAEDVRTLLDKTPYGPVQLFVGEAARKDTFTAIKAPRVLHVATHGYFVPDRQDDELPGDKKRRGGARLPAARYSGLPPLLRSGLVLAGANSPPDVISEEGWVTAEEVALMNLRGTELVVLSACESGLGDVAQAGEGVFGLRRAFLYAGAESLLVSLFPVPDAETRELMQGFYRRLATGKIDPADALHEAKRELIARRLATKGAAHPFFWASFIPVGGTAGP